MAHCRTTDSFVCYYYSLFFPYEIVMVFFSLMFHVLSTFALEKRARFSCTYVGQIPVYSYTLSLLFFLFIFKKKAAAVATLASDI